MKSKLEQLVYHMPGLMEEKERSSSIESEFKSIKLKCMKTDYVIKKGTVYEDDTS